MNESGIWNPRYNLEQQGIVARTARYNADSTVLLETSLLKREGILTVYGALAVNTGKFTGRSPKDKHIVAEVSTGADIWWAGNRGISEEHFNTLRGDSEAVVALSFEQKLVLIAGTAYSRENKKSAFTILNHIHPDAAILPMHCLANHAVGNPDDTDRSFGLSGTGETTFAADPERGVLKPEPTLSTCFGAPFLTRKPIVYAELFEKHLAMSGANVRFVNTGWSGGSAETDRRMPIGVTRSLLRAAIDKSLEGVEFIKDRVWGLSIPIDGPAEARPLLGPYETWQDKDAFHRAAADLRSRFSPHLLESCLSGLLIRSEETIAY